eukprot:11451354-Heterocapsa_arctica.AAC.1
MRRRRKALTRKLADVRMQKVEDLMDESQKSCAAYRRSVDACALNCEPGRRDSIKSEEGCWCMVPITYRPYADHLEVP